MVTKLLLKLFLEVLSIPVALVKLLIKKKASDFFRTDLIFLRF